MSDGPSFDGTIDRSPKGTECRGSEPACAGLDGTKAGRLCAAGMAGLGAARRSARRSTPEPPFTPDPETFP